ncbi:peptidoglycan bridge formation glycyltransferase FemA/FemB family protein [Chloroflexi bacterium CFX2]|nr:peptidoglycan bridge formation glycyltransferase FemA/FemB family protein [Chloroflexi bacterium CFX2]
MPLISLTDWNHFLTQHPNAHLLQTGEWGELKSAFGWKPVRVIGGASGAQILFRKLPLGFTIGYIPKPVNSEQSSVISNQLLALSNVEGSVVSDRFWQEIDDICRKHHAIFLKIEPDAWEDNFTLHNSSFIPSKHNIQPPRTLIIDIRGNEEEILAHMKQKTRYNIRLAGKKGVTVRAWNDIQAFHKMMLLTGGRDGFGVHSLEYYKRAYELFHPKDMCELLVAEYEDKPLAALFVARNGNRAYYLYGASTDEERNRMPTYLLQWEAMKWSKARGCEEYDLWGVPDEDEAILEANFETRRDGLWGVYRFKRGFGGELKRAAQAVDRVYNPWLYWLYLKFIGNRE